MDSFVQRRVQVQVSELLVTMVPKRKTGFLCLLNLRSEVVSNLNISVSSDMEQKPTEGDSGSLVGLGFISKATKTEKNIAEKSAMVRLKETPAGTIQQVDLTLICEEQLLIGKPIERKHASLRVELITDVPRLNVDRCHCSISVPGHIFAEAAWRLRFADPPPNLRSVASVGSSFLLGGVTRKQ